MTRYDDALMDFDALAELAVRPSPVPGMSLLEFHEHAENLKWGSRLTTAEIIRNGRLDFEREAMMRRIAGPVRET